VERIDGAWTNQNGSTVEFREAADGTLTGSYRSSKGRAAIGKHYPLSGVRNDEVVAFTVNWLDEDANLGSITSFSGRLVPDSNGEPTLHTVWILVRQWQDEAKTNPTGAWNAFLTNADVFHRK
jgi:hypothetical protein